MSEPGPSPDQSQPPPPSLAWSEAEPADERAPGETLNIDVAGFEGPLDLLLALARTQKVDLARISVLALGPRASVYEPRALPPDHACAAPCTTQCSVLT